jgi:SAM-dependent methyltransferase
MSSKSYFMESKEEAFRLDYKTDPSSVINQARWAGLHPGMRVVDIGCGPGKTSSCLLSAVEPGGSVVGVDASEDRLAFAKANYATDGLEFVCHDALEGLSTLGQFDFVWCRFLFEYHRERFADLLSTLDSLVCPGGIICVADLDYNCLSHFGLPERLEKTIQSIVEGLQKTTDFDPYAGRKLYSSLYDLGYTELDVQVSAHHLIFGSLDDKDHHNWEQKLKTAASQVPCAFELYEGGYEEFTEEFRDFFKDPRRFTYTPLIICRGRKPA